MNYQILIIQGNLSRDCELREVGDKSKCSFSVVVSGYKDSREFFDCVFWNCGRVHEYLTRGTSVLVEGRIQTDTWERDGEKKTKKFVVVNKLQLLGGSRQRSQESEIDEAMAAFDR